MLYPKTKWELAEVDHELYQQIMSNLGLSSPVARMLVRRNIVTEEHIKHFLTPSLSQLHSPFLLNGMEEAVERIQKAISEDEKIYIYGDYDVDGVSSTSLLLKVFHLLKANVDYYIPDRFKEGYGLNKEALGKLKDQGAELVITVDTGISAYEESLYAQGINLDLIITDHHEPPEKLPNALAVINPKKENCSYPFKELAGVGVAFKLASALLDRVPEEFLDIVALGTVADLVPLVKENRVLVTYGLKQLNLRHNTGLNALLDVSGVKENISESHVGFFLGPHINASGRLSSASIGVELLMTNDVLEAENLAEKLDQLNQERQQLVEEMTQEAIEEIERNTTLHDHFILVAKPNWHLGVVGIVASRLVEKYYRPVIVLSIDEEKELAKGSARGISSFDLYQALTGCKDLLLQYGGHKMAGGMTLEKKNLSLLHQRVTEIAQKTLTLEDYIPISILEDELTLEEIDEKLIEQIKTLAPFGTGNPVPYFKIEKSEVVRMQKLGEHRNHLKLLLKKENAALDAIGFRFGEIIDNITQKVNVDLVGELQINEWNGRRTPQLLIRDLGVSHKQVFDWRSNINPLPRLKKVDVTKCCYIYCQQSFIEGKVYQAECDSVVYWENMHNENIVNVKKPYIFFMDPPPSLEIFNICMKACKERERFYFLFGDKSFDEILLKIPSREDFKKVYAAIRHMRSTHGVEGIPQLLRVTKVEKSAIVFILKVFQELHLVEKKNDYFTCVHGAEKKELKESKLYCEQVAKEKVLEVFVRSSYEDLCSYVYKCLDYQWTSGEGEKDYELQR